MKTVVAATRVLCIGAAHWDVIGLTGAEVRPGDDLPGRVLRRPGGVAVNVARAIGRAGLHPVLLTALGDDAPGDELLKALRAEGATVALIHRMAGRPTGTYVAVEGRDGLVAAIADTATLDAAGAEILAPLRNGRLAQAGRPFRGAAVVDGNLAPALLAALVAEPGLEGVDLRLVPASPAKAQRLIAVLGDRACLFLNRLEAEAICGEALPDAPAAVAAVLARGARRAIVTDGPRLAAEASVGTACVTALPPALTTLIHVTGAGDTTLAVHLAAELDGASRQEALSRAVAAGARHVAGQSTPTPRSA